MKERFFKDHHMGTRHAVQRDLKDAGIGHHSQWREVIDVAHVPETEETTYARLFNSFKKFWNKEREKNEQSWSDTLDDIDVRNFYVEHHLTSLEQARDLLAQYVSDWKNVDTLTEMISGILQQADIQTLMQDKHKVSHMAERIASCWWNAISEYWYQKNLQVENYQNPRDVFGIDIYDVDVMLHQSQEVRDTIFLDAPELKEAYQRFRVEKKEDLSKTEDSIRQELRKKVTEKRDAVPAYVRLIDGSDDSIDDRILDELLGLQADVVEEQTDYATLRAQYPNEEFWPGGGFRWTPYHMVRKMLHDLTLKETDVLYDLGSGLGRIPIYASLTTPAQCRGIEIVPERAAASEAVKEHFQIDNLEITQGSVLDQNYEDGTVFFLFNPFSFQTLESVADTLKHIAQKKKIRVVSFGPSVSFFNDQRWLVSLKVNEHAMGLTIYESV